MASATESKNSSDLKVEDIEKKSTEPALDAHYDPEFVRKTM